MKKSVKILLSILCLCPVLLLTACGESNYYTINVGTSEQKFGYIISNYTDPRQFEGTTMTLTAIEKDQTNNPFICWIKDNNTVVSTDEVLTLTYNSSTAGDYVALFEETKPSGMIYMTLDNFAITGLDSYSNVTFSLSYSTINNISSNTTFESGSLSEIGEFTSNNRNVLYLGKPGETDTYQYQFKISLTIPTIDGNVTNTYTSTSGQYLNNDSFDDAMTTSINIVGDDGVNIVLNFEKLNQNMFNWE